MPNIIPKQRDYFRQYSLVYTEIKDKVHRYFCQTIYKIFCPSLIVENNQ